MSHLSLASRQLLKFHKYFHHHWRRPATVWSHEQGYSYGSIRRNGLGGLFSKSSGVGPGQRPGMSGQGVGTVRKLKT